MAECWACSRSDSRAFYCPSCVTTRLAEHYARRKQYQDLILQAQQKAQALLGPLSGSDASDHAESATKIGVRDESVLKADKWQLAIRLRDLRLVVDKTRNDSTRDKQDIELRRQHLVKRRDNLRQARALLDSLRAQTSSSSTTATATVGEPIASTKARHAWIQRQHHVMLNRIFETRHILTRELLSAYGFAIVQPSRPLPSPFKSPTSSTSSLTSSSTSSSATSTALLPPSLSGPVYTLGQQLLPPLSAMSALPVTQLSALLQHVMHLTRLFALYQDVCLPFTPIHSLFGPGLPGIKATPGWGEGVPSASSAQNTRAWPLFVSKSSNAAGSGKNADSQLVETVISDSELDATIGPFTTVDASQVPQQHGGRGPNDREAERKALKIKMAMIGAIALAYDLAFLAWTRGVDTLDVESLDDVGRLIHKAAGLTDAPSGRPGLKPTFINPRTASDQFPINFEAAVTKYTTSKAQTATRRAGGEDSADEEWDFV
ncbi:hypothetical protein ACM66B_002306 [Microbotryomycetes sp. NB124-2]